MIALGLIHAAELAVAASSRYKLLGSSSLEERFPQQQSLSILKRKAPCFLDRGLCLN
ncbi:MAG: hypothetical protein ACLFR1_12820 [Spirochaetia bacterium]